MIMFSCFGISSNILANTNFDQDKNLIKFRSNNYPFRVFIDVDNDTFYYGGKTDRQFETFNYTITLSKKNNFY
jgi:hypothetical protein